MPPDSLPDSRNRDDVQDMRLRDETSWAVPAAVVEMMAPAIGHVVIAGAFIDQLLDAWIATGKQRSVLHGLPVKLPFAWEPKAAYARSMLASVPEFAQLRDEGLALIERADAVMEMRHLMAHGQMVHYEETPEPVLIMRRVRLVDNKAMHSEQLEGVSPLVVAKASAEAQSVIKDMIAVAHRLLDADAIDGKPQTPS